MSRMTRPSQGIVARHLDHLTARGLADTTIRARRGVLDRLERHLQRPVLYATGSELLDWQVERAKTTSTATRHTEICHVREFYRWAVRERFIDEDPTTRLQLPRIPRRRPRPMRDRALLTVMQHAQPADAAILGLAAFAGLRAIEIARLDWSELWLDQEQPTLHVRAGKGGHSRTVPVSPALALLLVALPNRRGPVIPRSDGRYDHNSANAISLRAGRLLRAHGIEQTLHQARHRFGTATYQACRDIRAVQELMGHASPTTTAIYAEVAPGVAWEACHAAGTLAA